jgi:hypothetical protein
MLEVVRRAAWREFDRPAVFAEDGSISEPGMCMDVKCTFQDSILMEDEMSEKYYEAMYMLSGDMVIFGQLQEVEEMYIAKRMAEIGLVFEKAVKSVSTGAEISGPIVRKDEAQRIVYAPVLVPGEPDSDDEIITAEKIEQVAHGFMESYRNIDLMHTLNNVGFPVESYLLPTAMKVEAFGEPMILPVGTWILASKLSEEAWAGVMDGTLTGYSVMGIRKAHLEAAVKSEDGGIDEAAFKRTLLADLGPDWIAAFVSVVDNPAVPKAKFFAMKSKEFAEEDVLVEKPTFFAKVGKVLGLGYVADEEYLEPVAKAGRKFSDATYKKLKAAHDALGQIVVEAETERAPKSEASGEGVNDMDEAQLREIIAEVVKSAVEPIVERLDEVEKASKAVEEPLVEEVVEESAAEKAEEEVVEDPPVVEKAEEEIVADTPIVEPAAEKAEEEVVEEPVVEKAEEEVVEEPVVEKAEEEVVEELVVEKAEEEVVEDSVIETLVIEKSAEELVAEEADASFKAEVAARLELLEQRTRRLATSSKALPNDGGGVAVEVPDTSGRDNFGRRIKSK